MHRILLLLLASVSLAVSAAERPPNILLILADDLGYGDVGCYNPEAKVATPHLDRLAAEGMRFTDAHSPSTVCTPTRYSLLTGQMAFRIGYRGVFVGVNGHCLIKEDQLTLPGMLQDRGYTTALFGKWHVGMSFFDEAGEKINKGGVDSVSRVDFSRPIPDAPIHRGFDHFYGTVSCPTTDFLYAYVDGDRIPVPPTRKFTREEVPDHRYSRDCRPGMIAPDFDHEQVDLVFLEKSQAFLRQHVATKPEQPFFLFHSMQAVHLPSLAPPAYQGTSGKGPHGDFLLMMDDIVGKLLATLDELGVADDTLVIFCSDNGPEVPTVLNMRKTHDHDGARPWRGVKRDQWEGGHRTPFLLRWPGQVPAGTTSDQMTSLVDIMTSCAALVDYDLPVDAAEDGYNLLPVWLGQQGEEPVRRYLLQQTMNLSMSIRDGHWKYLDHQGSGGNNYERKGEWSMKPYKLPDTDPDAPGQLYDLSTDPGETTNLYSQHPEIVARLKAKLEAFKAAGRSAPLPGGDS